MEPFITSTYEIATSDERHVCAELFKSNDQILDYVSRLPTNVYHVRQVIGTDARGSLETEWWGELEKHSNGDVTYSARARETV